MTDINVLEIAQKIFERDAGMPNSIRLEIERLDNNILYEVLSLFLMEGIDMKYQSSIKNIDRLPKELLEAKMIKDLRNYFKSFGFDFDVEIGDSSNYEQVKFVNTPIYFDKKTYCFESASMFLERYYNPFKTKATELKDLKLLLRVGKYVFEVTFKYHYSL
jgi:hypothetical protein